MRPALLIVLLGVATVAAPPAVAKGRPVRSSLQAMLVGTVVADDPGYSMGMITDMSRSETSTYRVGDRLMGQARVVAIGARRVLLERGGALEYLALGVEPAGGKGEASAARPAPVDAGGQETTFDWIAPAGANQYRIDQAGFQRVMTSPMQYARDIRVVPAFSGGESEGFKVFSIRPGSLFSSLGLQNGDVLQKVNGYRLDSPERMLEIYQKLKSARSIEVELTRRGRPATLGYSIE